MPINPSEIKVTSADTKGASINYSSHSQVIISQKYCRSYKTEEKLHCYALTPI